MSHTFLMRETTAVIAIIIVMRSFTNEKHESLVPFWTQKERTSQATKCTQVFLCESISLKLLHTQHQ